VVVVLLLPGQVVLVEVGQVVLQPQMQPPELLTPAGVAGVAEAQAAMVATAALASSSLNTPHHYNPYSHSKVLPVG
jgi:allophanate hydrolase subunit 1